MEAIKLNPEFENLVDPSTIIQHVQKLTEKEEPIRHEELLEELLGQFEPIDFEALVFPEVEQMREQLQSLDPDSEQAKGIISRLNQQRLSQKHYLIETIENVTRVAESQRWGMCKNQDFIYLYNGAYWTHVDEDTIKAFLGDAALKMGVPRYDAKFHLFRDGLLKQFLTTNHLPTPDTSKDAVFINLKNGTFQITPEGNKIRPFDRADFMTYQLPFSYDPDAIAPIWQKFLDKVLPDKQRQKVLAEFIGYVFIKNGGNNLKLEKALILFGTGANGKSVVHAVLNALLGHENVSSYSLQSLTDTNGYYRAMIANKLANYASEISVNLETAVFKQLCSGEPVEARLPYGRPLHIRQYAKLIFNCNELPKDVEHTNAYFRRFLIIPFDVTIPEREQDKQLHARIIETELSGVFNWVLEGLNRLLEQKGFSDCEAAVKAVENYKNQSDSVKLYLDDNNFRPSPLKYRPVAELYAAYKAYCIEDGFRAVNKNNFKKRLEGFGIEIQRRNTGYVAFLQVSSETSPDDGKAGKLDDADLPF